MAGMPICRTYDVGTEVATRERQPGRDPGAGGRAVPELFGGAADLSESNLTDVKGEANFSADEAGRNLRFGVREHAMGGVANGLAYHAGFIPYVATFLNFSDYMRGSVRLAALSGLHVVYVWTHDLGGPRARTDPLINRSSTTRPSGRSPTCRSSGPATPTRRQPPGRSPWSTSDGPVALALTRQKLPVLPGTAGKARDGVARGGYVLREAAGGAPQLIAIGTGSELQLAFAAAEALEAEGIPTRVVSLPCWERFEAQDQAYRDAVLPPAVRKRVSVEIGVPMGWERWVGDEGAIIGLDHFGASAPAPTIFEHLGFTAERVTDVARRVVRDGLRGRIPPLGGDHT